MSRAPVLVRDAVEGDAGALCSLWADLVVKPDVDDVGVPALTVARQAVQRLRDHGGGRIVVAEADEVVVGCAYLRIVQMSPLHEEQVVQLSHIKVSGSGAGAGVERALIEAAVGWAEQHGIATLATSTAANDREANRFLARLGLGQVAVVRGASVTGMRSRLPVDPSAAMRGTGRSARNVGQVVAVRRSQRRSRNRDIIV